MRKTTTAALLLFYVLSLVLTYPLPLHLADAVEDRQDALLNVWITAWDGHQLLIDPLHLFDANIFHPYTRTLAYSELLLGNALLALPITAASGTPVLGYNVALLLSFVLSGLGTYLLVLQLTRSLGAGLVAGTLFAFSSYRMSNVAQAQLLTTQWMPFALLSLYQLLRRPRPRHVATFVLFFCLQALSSFYYGIFLALAIVVLGLGYLGFECGSRILRPSPLVLGPLSSVVSLLLAACCCALVILPFAQPYLQVQRELGFERTLANSEPFSASLRQYLMVPPNSVLHGRWLPSDSTPIVGGYPANALFPGLAALALAGWGLIRGQGRTRLFFFLLLLVCWILSFGPRLYLAPGQPSGLDVTLPYAWLYAIIPGFKALRAPIRLDALVMLSLAVLAGYGVAALTSDKQQAPREAGKTGKRASLLLIPGLLLLVVLESWVWPATHAVPVPVGGQVPPVYRWLADQPPEPVLELPMAFTPGGPQLDYQYLSTYHWQTTPDGYSGFIPPRHGPIVYEMERFPSERSMSLLQALGVRTVVIHTDRYPADRWPAMRSTLAGVADMTLVKTFGADQVYRVQPRSFDSHDLAVHGHLPPRATANQLYTAYLIILNEGTRSYAIPPTASVQATATWEGPAGSITSCVRGDMPMVTSPDGVAVILLSLRAPSIPGSYQLTIHRRDGPLGDWTVGSRVQVGDRGDDAFPVPAQLVAWNLPSVAHRGGSLAVGLVWRALGKIDAYYSVYVKLLNAEGNALAGWDGQPRIGQAPTLLWVPDETIDDVVNLNISADIPPGDYTVEVGMYRAEDLARCLTLNQDRELVDRVMLGTVRIEP